MLSEACVQNMSGKNKWLGPTKLLHMTNLLKN